jgi:hypothetical protein
MRRLRIAVNATILAALVIGSSGDARADERGQARVAARQAMIDGDLARARDILRAAPSDAGSADRAAAAELLYVIDLWSSKGRPPAVTGANDAPVPDSEEDWEHAFANGRNLLVVGQYAEAARRFDALVGAAPDLVAGARAAELRALARDGASGVQATVPPAPAVVAPPPPRDDASRAGHVDMATRWYGWQTLLSDGLAVVATPLLPPLGIGLYFLGAPTVHLAHVNGWGILGSLGVRIVAPTIGYFIGAAAAEGCTGLLCEVEGGAWGALVGAGIAAVVDAAFIAREQVPVEKKTATIAPLVMPGRVGIGGSF